MNARMKFVGYFKMRTGNGEWRKENGKMKKPNQNIFKLNFEGKEVDSYPFFQMV